MSQVTLTKQVAPGPPAAGKITFYAKSDGRLYYMDEFGTEIAFKPVGVGSGDLLSDGTVPLTANWDVGSFKITALQFESDATTGTAPFIVASTTLVTNLNADLLDGLEATAFATAAQGSTADSALQPEDINTLGELNTLVADATILAAADIGTSVQAWSAVLDATTASFLIADETKLDGIEALADVTDEANVVSSLNGATLTGVTAAVDDKVVIQDTSDTDNIKTITTQSIRNLAQTNNNNVQSGTTYTIVEADNGKNIIFTNAAAIAVGGLEALSTNFECTVIQAGAGVPTVTPSTDTINGTTASVAPSAQFKGMYLNQYATSTWVAVL
jgi:hypothetical protein